MDKTVLGLKPGTIIQDTYRIDSLLGEGGMGATFLGENMAAGHKVAIKVMTPEFAKNKRALELFKRESSLLRTVQNDVVVRYETTLQDKSGKLYLVMEYIAGKPLRFFLDKGARLASKDVLKLGERLASGLAAIHKLGIVHRDVAPDNILVPDDDILGAKFIDFGLASDTVGTDKSILGSDFAGKLKYCAPEQLGLFDNNVTPATDVYALGLVLMRTAGLALPGENKGWAAVDDRRENIKIDDPSLSPALRNTLQAMLKADPKDRPTDLLGIIRKALQQEDGKGGGAGGNTGAGNTGGTPKKSNTGIMVAAAAVLAALIGGGAWFAMNQDGGKTNTSGSGSETQSEIVKDTLAEDDAISGALKLVDEGGSDNLNAAFGTLFKLSKDAEQPRDVRIRASILAAEMYDPETHDTKRSPFPTPNPGAAKRFYQTAADLGSDAAQKALTRLSN